jgi:hypothetical protein
MPAPVARRTNHRPPRSRTAPTPAIDLATALVVPIGVVLIVAFAAAASLAQASQEVFIAASLVFSLGEGVVLAIVGFKWSRRGVAAAMLAAALTAGVASPARWEVRLLMQSGQAAAQQLDLLVDLLVSIAWGAFAGLAGATVLYRKLATLMHDEPRPRASDRRPR